MTNKVKFVKLRAGAKMPYRGSMKSAAYDLSACLDTERIVIPPHKTVKIGTGLAITPPSGYFGALFARSGMATKYGLRPANCTGVADEDYTGEYIIPLHNDSGEERTVCNGERIAQLIFLPYLDAEWDEVNSLEMTERADNGFGSTGI